MVVRTDYVLFRTSSLVIRQSIVQININGCPIWTWGNVETGFKPVSTF